jgi:putative transposase
MVRPLRITYIGAFYHVTSRGNKRRAVFKSYGDRERFLEYLSTASQRHDAVVHAHNLMDDHYHLLLQTTAANLSQTMRISTRPVPPNFIVKRTRCGHLFQGHYKAILADVDEYANELSRYFNLNPVRAKLLPAPLFRTISKI